MLSGNMEEEYRNFEDNEEDTALLSEEDFRLKSISCTFPSSAYPQRF